MSHHELPGIGTRCVRGGQRADPSTGAILTPIVQSTTYVHTELGVHHGHTYSRASNPTVSALEANLATLEDAPPAVAFASGLAAEHALFLTLLKSGDHVVCSEVIYGGTFRLLTQLLCGLGVESTFVDSTNPQSVREAIRTNTRLVFVETPANPTLVLTDIGAIARLLGEHERKSGTKIRLGVDNTFLTPVGQRPLDLGADVCVYSTTKHIEGHNSTIGGAIVSRDEELLERLRGVRKSVGSIQAPLDAWLTIRGIKTLPCRLREHSRTALTLAEWFQSHSAVRRVHYPGLASSPGRAIADRQHLLHGGILAVELAGGESAARRFVNALRLASLAESLGAVETLVTHPATMTHPDVPVSERERLGITGGLVRVSAGLEDVYDLIADFAQALDASAFCASREQTLAATH